MIYFFLKLITSLRHPQSLANKMGLHRLLVPAVGIAGSLATAMSCTNMTVHAAEESMPKLYKPSELPLYGDPEPAMFELIEPEDNRYTLAVSSMRKGTWDFVDSIQDTITTVTDKWSVAKAHTNDSLTYIQEDAGLLPRTALITVAGLGGIVAGYKGGIFRKMLFGTVATLSAVSLCYPNEAVEIGQASWRFTKDQAQAAIGSRIPGLSSGRDEFTKKLKKVDTTDSGSDDAVATDSIPASKSLGDMGMSRKEDNDMYTEHARK